MEKVKFNTLMKNAHNQYKRSSATDLFDLYASYSCDKYRAYLYCRDLCNKYNGHNFTLWGNNTFSFSAGFEYYDEDENLHFVYITKAHDRDCIIF